MNQFKNKLKSFFEKFFLIDDTPHKIAAGLALGVFLGMIPGLGIGSALVLASLLRLNRLSATAGALAVNLWASFLLLPVAAFFGGVIFREDYSNLILVFEKNFPSQWEIFLLSEVTFFNFTLPIIIGFFLTSGILAMLVYYIFLFILKRRKINRLEDEIKLKREINF